MTTRSRNRDEAPATIEPPAGSIADIYRAVMPLVDFDAVMDKGGDVALTVAPTVLHEVLERGRDDARLKMNLLRNLTAVDWVERGLELVYHLYSIDHRHAATIKTWLPGEGAVMLTVTDLYLTADWAERECREMFGIEFLGHPDPRNLLLDEDLDIHPLRKSHPLAPIEIEQGVDVEYFTKEFPPEAPVRPQAEEAAAAAARPARRPDSELTEEERAAKRAEQAERVARARELAAARRLERAAGAPAAGGPRPEGTAPPPAPIPAATAPAAAPAAAAAPATTAADRPEAPPPPELPTIPDAEEDPEGRAAAQAERMRIGRELAAARRAQLRGE